MKTEQIIEKLLETGGAIISSDSCHPAEIAIARASGNFALHGAFGLVLKPKRWVDGAKNAHERLINTTPNDALFRALLQGNGVGGSGAYCWNNGDPTYLGDPISGRANESERAAIDAMPPASR